jgi:hypothetical protein
MQDFRRKLYKSNDKILLSEASAPNTSNNLFNSIEKFDVADNYKKKTFENMPDIDKLIQKNKRLFMDINNHKRIPEDFKCFHSMRKFQVIPNDGIAKDVFEVDPPLMRNRSPPKYEHFSRLKLLINSTNHRPKTVV